MTKRQALQLETITMNCATCGGRLLAYPDPLPRGTLVCLDGCSPAWLADFAAWKHAHRTEFYDERGRPRSEAEARRRLDATPCGGWYVATEQDDGGPRVAGPRRRMAAVRS
jgi:hypothetical protein